MLPKEGFTYIINEFSLSFNFVTSIKNQDLYNFIYK